MTIITAKLTIEDYHPIIASENNSGFGRGFKPPTETILNIELLTCRLT
ncbi:hypothetical protein [Anabaena lutea]|uniref:Uncharacterized protein n=1 Tax=Anabaena lutea FACHB-196 TaxID=2692881 RepID=A0ABR8FJ75_9NOST|nr:hypothetical protein [Anabaena lutea]MBD2568989.1 hypothetical protein [Anabaena lutea FACHB-196]